MIECKMPEKRIPSIKIKEIETYLTKEEILAELEDKEELDIGNTTIKVLLKNEKFKTNRAIVNFKKEDTVRIAEKGYVKIGLKIHPIEVDYNIVQCKNCNKYGHYHKTKDGGSTNCRSKIKICVHCTGNHVLSDCPVKNERSKAKCSNCKGNHRAYDSKCPRRYEILKKIKEKFIC
jgi:hypothetical protein